MSHAIQRFARYVKNSQNVSLCQVCKCNVLHEVLKVWFVMLQDHFKPTDIEAGAYGRKRINSTAVPSLFGPVPCLSPRRALGDITNAGRNVQVRIVLLSKCVIRPGMNFHCPNSTYIFTGYPLFIECTQSQSTQEDAATCSANPHKKVC